MRALREKSAGVENLRNEVEHLSVGEVEDLCGVVEEGLREQRWSGRDPADPALKFLVPQKTGE